ncbi:MAG: hypothetical protein HKN59_07205 [Gammaproteobacteria bacterium]|nr:hypothetical protein [Gammaproteobacteria bacterium]
MELELVDMNAGSWGVNMAGKKNDVFTGGKERKGDRRVKGERRDMLRFEIDKEPRRKGQDRRHDSAWDGRHEN